MHDQDHEHYTIPPGASDPKTAGTLVVGVLGILLTGLTILGLEVVFYKAEDREHQRKVIDVAPEELGRARAAQLEKLQGYQSIDESSGKYAIPIEKAMQRIVERDRSRRSASRANQQ